MYSAAAHRGWGAVLAAATLLLSGAAIGQNASPPGGEPIQPRQTEVVDEANLPPPSEGLRRVSPDAPVITEDDRTVGEDPATPQLEVPWATGTIGWGWAIAGLIAAAVLAYLSRLAVRSMRRRTAA